jgi:hypothetical protein
MYFCHNTNARGSHSVTFKEPSAYKCIPTKGTMSVTKKRQR